MVLCLAALCAAVMMRQVSDSVLRFLFRGRAIATGGAALAPGEQPAPLSQARRGAAHSRGEAASGQVLAGRAGPAPHGKPGKDRGKRVGSQGGYKIINRTPNTVEEMST